MSAINESGDAISASGESFGTIGEEVDQVGQAMDGNNLSIRELASGSDEILRATASLNELTVNVTTVVQESREQESAVHENVENMGSFINSLKQNMSEINGGTGLIRDVSADLRNKCNTINTFVQVFSEKLSEGSV
jgi:methyl-accepting chemotaxis protein